MKVLGYKMFLESELNLQVLDKEISGQKRGDVLVNKLKTGQEIILNNNKGVKVDKMKSGEDWSDPEEVVDDEITTDGEYDSVKAKKYFLKGNRYRNVFKEEDGSEFKLNQFKKTQEFGSSGPGRLTDEFESLQCLFLAIRQLIPTGQLSQSIQSLRSQFIRNLDEAKKYLYVKNPEILTLELYDKFANDKDWTYSFYKISNRLFHSNTTLLDRVKTYKIYHTAYKGLDSPYTAIKNKYREISKSKEFSDIDFNKFLPADVFLISTLKQQEMLKEISEISGEIQNLVDYLDNKFDTKELIPLSFKKIKQGGEFRIIINKEVGKELPEFYIRSFKIGDASQDEMRGIGSKIFTRSYWKDLKNKNVDRKDRELSIDSSDTSKSVNVDAEVVGSSSRHGKVSFNALKRMISQADPSLQKLEAHSELSTLELQELKNKVISLKVAIEQQARFSKLPTILTITPYSRGKDITGSKNKLISRIQSMQVVLAILQIHTKNIAECDQLINKIMRYALSIQTDKFTTPRYLRVI